MPLELKVWLCDLTYTQQTIAADVMPNAIGGIATFVEQNLDLTTPIRLFKYPEKLAEALNTGPLPDIIGFSNYIWNSSLSEGFARIIKKHSPRTIIVFGGPNYNIDPGEQESYLRARPMIDFYIVKEGELAFLRLIEELEKNKRDCEAVKRLKIPSIHAMGKDGTAYLTTTIERIQNLADIPSAYVNGKLDEFFDGMLLPIIQTNRGCPFTCTFCVEGVSYYNKVYRNSDEKVTAELDYIGRKMADLRERGGRNDLFIADSNFGMYREDLDTCLQLANTRKTYGWPEYINVATGKNQKERVLEAARLLEGALRLSGSVQSLDETVLKNIKRNNISADGLMDLALKASEAGANSYSEIILGLPGDSKVAHYRTVETVMTAGFTNLYLFQLMMLPGTNLDTPATRKQFGMDCRFRVLPRCYGHFEVLSERMIAAEIEEVCVANSTLSFEDYLDCRRMHLIITIFHNDGVFGTLLKLLRQLKISTYRWMELLRQETPRPGLASLYESFEKATRGELWDKRENLRTFIEEPGHVEQFISGELGNNLLFLHKTLAITRHVADLADLALQTMRRCLEEAGQATAENLAFVEDALKYHQARMSKIFDDRDSELETQLQFDIPAFENARQPGPVTEYRLETPQSYRFALDESQKALIDRYLAIYGESPVGIGRILSKVYVRKLFRHPITDEASLKGESEYRLRIAGLQN
jgi:radical SAM superfamily enzyme YgiQ (UPF0313 family)